MNIRWNTRGGIGQIDRVGGLVASCDGVLIIGPPPDDSPGHLISLNEAAHLEITRGSGETLVFDGDALSVRVAPIASNRADATAGMVRNEVVGATIIGNVRGQGANESVAARRLQLDRVYDEPGRLLYDELVLDGPATIDLALRDPAGTAREQRHVEATHKIRYRRPASPFDEGVLVAESEAIMRRARSDGSFEELRGARIEARLGAEDAAGRRPLVRLDLKGLASARDERGSSLVGDEISWDRVAGVATLVGEPAKATWFDRRDDEQTLQALRIRLQLEDHRLHAEGRVESRVRFPALILNGARKRAIRAAERDLEAPPEDLDWKVHCEALDLRFRDRVPLIEAQTKKGPWISTLQEIHLEGAVSVRNDDQSIDAQTLHYDFGMGGGWAEGTPLIIRTRAGELGSSLEDRFEGPKVVVRREWTLFEQRSECLIHIAPEHGPADRREPLFVRCEGDVLVREATIRFDGPCTVERGPRNAPHTTLSANRAVAQLTGSGHGRGGFGTRLSKLEGQGNVDFRWREVTGQGDVFELDYPGKRILLRTESGRCKMSHRGRSMSMPRLLFDMRRNVIDIWRPEGQLSGGRGKQP